MMNDLEKVTLSMIKDFSKGNMALMKKLWQDKPLIYRLVGMKEPVIMVDYMYKTPQDPQEYKYLVDKSIKESCDHNMFPGYNLK